MTSRTDASALAEQLEDALAAVPGITDLYRPGRGGAVAAAARGATGDRGGTHLRVTEETGGRLHIDVGIGVAGHTPAPEVARAAQRALTAHLDKLEIAPVAVRVTVLRVG
ncbi:hypothetical protein U746_2231 [Mycolicibacterium mucogenicum 261Sha1.1M5]|nr:hypothetical protein U746_2231 [Mycolicibacterium mucogenicum 261Sha1.1M5]